MQEINFVVRDVGAYANPAGRVLLIIECPMDQAAGLCAGSVGVLLIAATPCESCSDAEPARVHRSSGEANMGRKILEVAAGAFIGMCQARSHSWRLTDHPLPDDTQIVAVTTVGRTVRILLESATWPGVPAHLEPPLVEAPTFEAVELAYPKAADPRPERSLPAGYLSKEEIREILRWDSPLDLGPGPHANPPYPESSPLGVFTSLEKLGDAIHEAARSDPAPVPEEAPEPRPVKFREFL